MKPSEFQLFLKERFGLQLPKEVQLSKDKGSAIRVYANSLNGLDVYGSRGFVAYSEKTGVSSDFIQLFGKFAKKNIVQVNENEAKKIAYGEKVNKRIKTEKGPVIISFNEHILGIATFDGRVLHSKIREKRERKICNKIS
jgi:NOL1/NOP2/fmu family ribosome biogenesis protein